MQNIPGLLPLKLAQSLLPSIFDTHDNADNVFYTLIFFDLFAAIAVLLKTNSKREKDRKLAAFCLRILPHIIGAYRFGVMHNLLRDSAFKFLNSTLYDHVEKEILSNTLKESARNQVKATIHEIAKRFESDVKIKSRVKGSCSAYIKSINYNMPISKLWNLFALRIIISTNDSGDCYRFLSFIEDTWGRWDNKKGYFDYIAKPKANGYRSIHLVVVIQNKLVEIQIRTTTMDGVAEFGSASHLSAYKAQSVAGQLEKMTITEAAKGKRILEKKLKKHGLSLDDFIEHLQSLGNVLDVVSIDHYYEGISTGKYDVEILVSMMRKGGGK